MTAPRGPFACHGYRTLFASESFDVAEYVCPGTPAETAIEAARHPEIVMVRVGAYVRCDAAGAAFLDPAAIGFFEADRPYVIRHHAPRPDITTIIALKDPSAVAATLRLEFHPERVFARSVVRAAPEAQLLHRRLHLACRSGDGADVEEIAATLILAAASANHDIVMADDGRALLQKEQAIAIAEYVNARFREPIGLADIGAATGLSPFQICRLFRAHMGASVRQRILALRLDAAVAALLETDASITNIALDLGFSSHSHLTAMMTRALGAPPNAVRAAGSRKILKAHPPRPVG